MKAAGRLPSLYGTHSLRIGGGTARAFVGGDPLDIKDAGKWSSDAYLRYVRARREECLRLATLACGAAVDDLEQEFFAIEIDPALEAWDYSDVED